MTNAVSSLFSSSEVASIVSQLQARIQAPITLEQTQIKADNAQISALGAVRGALSSLNGALSGLANPASLKSMSASTSASAVATASAKSSAASGSYALSNVKLARSQEIYSGSFGSAGAVVGAGSGALTFTFSSGTSAKIAIPSSADTVSGVAQAINTAQKGITASVVNTATGVRLVLQSTATGSSKAFSVAGSGAVAGLSYGSGAGTMTLGQAARNASFTLNGVPISETSNSGVTLVNGLTVKLQSSGSATISVKSSTANLSAALSTFANRLDNAVGVIAKQTAYVAASAAKKGSASSSAKSGPLLGDVQIQQLKQDLLSAVSSAASGGLTANALGFSISSSGKLSFSSATFATAYAANPTAADSFIKTLETKVSGIVTGAIGTSGASSAPPTGAVTTGSGFVGAAANDLKSSVTSLQSQIATQTTIGNQQIANLEQQFTSAINQTSGASTTLTYLSILMGSGSSHG
ncbi:MAG: flagellar filament capping protein FliD [Paracoccaceae bacterium]|nr:flagellar filament capping protein FliD [Paracoccaceae bacterium]